LGQLHAFQRIFAGTGITAAIYLQAVAATVGLLGLVRAVSSTIPADADVSSAEVRTFESVIPWGMPARLLSFVRERVRKREWIALSQDFRFNAATLDTLPRIAELVIGESAAATHWQLGGSARKTNPALSKRTDIIWLKNYAAPAMATAASVPIMLSPKPVLKGNDMVWPERSIVSAYRETGFETHWISNQLTAGMHVLMISTFVQDGRPAAMVYVSDQGETMLSAQRKMLRHVYGTPADVLSAGVVWLSLHARHVAPRLTARRAVELPLSGSHLFASLINADNLTLPNAQLHQNGFSQEFRPVPRLVSVFGRVLNADAKTKPCETYPDAPVH